MRKDWLYWIGGGSSKSSKRGRFTREDNATPPPPPPAPSGCMCFQIFDLNHFHFPLVQQQQPSKLFDDSGLLQDDFDHEPTTFKGVEAPRNSLELEENLSSNEASIMSSTMKEEANFTIPMGIQIRTSWESKSPRESTSECSSSSPGTKTPGVVARLMGLDILPQGGSPSSSRFSTPTSTSSMKSRLHHHYSGVNRDEEDRARNLLQDKSSNGTRSLPGTPRVSSSSDRRSDVDQSRHSLQLTNKKGDNNAEDEQFDLASYIAKRVLARRREELTRSSCQENETASQRRHYAKQIVNQMKENVSRRKFGIDITNSVKQKDEKNVVLLKPNKKSFRENYQNSSTTSKQSTPSCSPRLKLMEIKNHQKPPPPPPVPLLLSNKSQTSPPKISPENKIYQEMKPEMQLIQKPKNHLQPKAIHKVASERYNLHFKKSPPASGVAIIWNKKEESFIRSPPKNKDNNSRKFPLSNELLNNNVPTILPLKKDNQNSLTTKLFHKQSREVSKAQSSRKTRQQLPRSLSQSYDTSCSVTIEEKIQKRCNNKGLNKTSSVDGEVDVEKRGYYYHYQYIERIMKRTGIDPSTAISLTKWYSPTHPLDPAIFQYIELFHHPNNSGLNLRSNRKLIFHLADEIIAQILKPYINFKPWVQPICPRMMSGSELIAEICSTIESYPSANCEVLEDIDTLIEKSSFSSIDVAFEEEGEGIVRDIEGYIVEYLVHETAEEVVEAHNRNRV